MNCAEVMEWMHRYLDHDLSPDESLEMFRHIDNCPSCAELFERLNALSQELEQLPDVSPPFSLVDSILPKLEAIDRESDVAAAGPAEEPQALTMSRKASRARDRSSSLASRFGIGAAAAAVVLAIAIFNLPEKLPGAQVEQMTNSNADLNRSESSAGSSGDDAALKQKFGVEVGSSSGEENSTPTDTGASIMAAPDSSSPAEGGQTGQGGGAAPETADPAERSTDNRTGEPAKGASPGTEDKGVSKRMATPSATAETSESPNADKELSDSPSDPMIPENTLEGPSFKDGAAGIMGIAPIETPPGSSSDSPSWTSPDGRYTAVVEGQKLVIYGAVGKGAEGRQAVDTISFEGKWVSGEWSADSRQFTYVTSADGKELHGAYTVPQETTGPSATPSAPFSSSPESPTPSSSAGASTK